MNETLLDRTPTYFDTHCAGFTAREIMQQPVLWRELAGILTARREDIEAFMREIETINGLRVIFTGAGSSAFIGEVVQALLAAGINLRGEAVHTTDIVSAPDSALLDVPTLIVSFSRSGESPESSAALRYAAQKIRRLYNLVIVCRENSSVADYASRMSNTLTLCMPPSSCDQGFAMTSSVSCMALAAWTAFHRQRFDACLNFIKSCADTYEQELLSLDRAAREIAGWRFDRLVFLGSGPLRGLAREAAIKMLELTGGQVNASWDSPMGFRHGPKSILRDSTLTVHFISPVPLTRLYDRDLLNEMNSPKRGWRTVCVSSRALPAIADREVTLPAIAGENSVLADYLGGLLFSQLLALEKSLLLGIKTDDPSVDGIVNRVVQNVVIYPLDGSAPPQRSEQTEP